MLWEFRNRKICCVYDQGVITDCQVHNWMCQEMNSDQDFIRPWSICFKRIGGMQSAQKYSTHPNPQWQVFFQGRLMTYFSRISLQVTTPPPWVFYDDAQCKRQWIDMDEYPLCTPKVELQRRKVWQDHHCIIHFEFLNCRHSMKSYTLFPGVMHGWKSKKIPPTSQ